MAAEEALLEARALLAERDMLFEEIDGLHMRLREDFRTSVGKTEDQ